MTLTILIGWLLAVIVLGLGIRYRLAQARRYARLLAFRDGYEAAMGEAWNGLHYARRLVINGPRGTPAEGTSITIELGTAASATPPATLPLPINLGASIDWRKAN